ncbi:hypothetical protein RV04_GL001521 [Enterococcus hermanniensis]|uniref:Replication initiator A N-terminal domain-containing protein n=2 Tax=Enterococcus hermanniensis TaxID=249189 RepID=A0A1L8TPU8_9ENTE|nr:hypothetical protein RV04_GL001521 [Enterococcus hermanniensis]
MTATNLPMGNYIPIDLNLINNPRYEALSIEAMMLHALYTMRMTCSIYNSQKDGTWLDEGGHPYIYFSNEEAASLLRVSERKVTNLKNALAELELIQVSRHGLKNYRIYVANPQAPEAGTAIPLAFKNFMSTKKIQPVDYSIEETRKLSPVDREAKSAAPSSQNLLTSTQKQLAKNITKTTNVTSVTAKSAVPAQDSVLIEALEARYAHLLPHQVFQRLLPFCENSYEKARYFIDTIFKAKYSSNKQWIDAGLPAESEVLTFEHNSYFSSGLSDAIAKAIEQMYRYKNVANPEAFFFTFMRGFFTEKTRQYLVDHYQMTTQLEQTLSTVQQKILTRKKQQKQYKTQKVSQKAS